MVFDETNPMLPDPRYKNADDEDILMEKQPAAVNQSIEKENQSTEKAVDRNLPKEWIEPKGLSKDNIIGDMSQRVSTRHKLTYCEHVTFVSQIEPKNLTDALGDSNWVVAMQDELINSPEMKYGL